MNKLEQFKCSIFTPLKNQQKESFKEFGFFDEQKNNNQRNSRQQTNKVQGSFTGKMCGQVSGIRVYNRNGKWVTAVVVYTSPGLFSRQEAVCLRITLDHLDFLL